MIRSPLIAAALALAVCPAAIISARPGPGAAQADQARDHASILRMAGTYKVTFDMRETVPFVAGYKPYEAKISGGHEVVKAVLDTPGHIILQHLLVVDTGTAKPLVIKHWRQDWTWQPKSVLVYTGPGRWTLRPLSAAEAQGNWSQTVWQTDDSPRYGAIGRWRYDDGVARWMSEETRRPLARRDATRHPPYDHYLGTNRHALTPDGWVQEQDNAKIGPKDGTDATFVHEVVINSYVPARDFPIAAAETYWAKTADYWASVRADWDKAIAKGQGLRLGEEADNGSVTGHELMLIADDIASGEIKPDEGRKEASEIIAKGAAE
ncbi:DUF6607 family protein [Sphingomonas sp.]|uniref:DUF6607 family protein n=1 Tax=Sphingomonas sp. TaxID=28214 RepID=UPI000DB878C1|nr:DUF6607 family protein [Sphingomonas sp.]PZU07990.1 MAG: hypothetical protein DI605_14050 [Sphingomonas sp.]